MPLMKPGGQTETKPAERTARHNHRGNVSWALSYQSLPHLPPSPLSVVRLPTRPLISSGASSGPPMYNSGGRNTEYQVPLLPSSEESMCREIGVRGVKKEMGVVAHFVLDTFLVFILVLIQVCIRC